jgi:uncharacterized protein YndB with AHSA1/START domain
MSKNRFISATRFIPASPQAIFDFLADPTKHPLLDGTKSVLSVKKAPARLSLGAKFSMNMMVKKNYSTTNTVSSFEEGKVIAWHHWARFIWRYDLEPVEGGTQVTESFDYNRPWGFTIEKVGFIERNQRGMESSLELLEKLVTSS